ncbi:MAG: methyltransferase domain-containing protein [Asgard group archaeon]|nr:methyltransferase domain-containing protein [Asgard group archaeon]
MIKLNLGCGIFYKPGYINIDLVEDKIADQIADVTNLPYEENSVDLIEASHIIEHFDVNQVPFVLSEWYRILKPGGKLEIEIPNLLKSVIKLKLSKYRKQLLTLKFLFGVDYRGNIHKIGFTRLFLKKSLSRTGFKKIRRKKQRSFKEERGMRYQASKPLDADLSKKKHFITTFRSEINSNFEIKETLFYEVLENNCFLSLFNILPENIQKFFNTFRITNFCASLSIIHPKLSKIFLEIFPENQTNEINKEVLDYLDEIKFQSLLLTDWIKWRKDQFNFPISITKFFNHWTWKINQMLNKKTDFKKMLSYLTSLEQNSNEFFSIEIINIQSLRLANQGIRAFEKEIFVEAKKLLEESLRMNPSNIEANLNLARLLRKLDHNPNQISNLYEFVLSDLSNRRIKRKIRKEYQLILLNKEKKEELSPIQLRS